MRSLLASVALLVTVGTARPAEEDLPGPKIKWPEVVGLDKQKARKFDDTALGYSIAYLGEGLVVTIFVYDLDLDKIPTGPNSDTLKAEMYSCVLVLEANKSNGRYKSLQPLDEKVIPFGTNKTAPQIRRKRYEVEITKEGPAITELYLTGYKNHFLKIRATYPTNNQEKNEKILAELLEGLSQGLK